ncbi:hypothetical protein [Hydrogenophaga sp.]|uniref:hypothetical protein n=1 Tax=Hydrogenophaga sp. TaxID=1904254 RepID=UPI0027351E01|nr:hypothetical protein [Hydrogenophaga sp.]MDP3885341.1 hypothetical protein [Hydrogenophaga sp.]
MTLQNEQKKQAFMTTYLPLCRPQTPMPKGAWALPQAPPLLQRVAEVGSQERVSASLLFVSTMQHMNHGLGSKSLTDITVGDRDEPNE